MATPTVSHHMGQMHHYRTCYCNTSVYLKAAILDRQRNYNNSNKVCDGNRLGNRCQLFLYHYFCICMLCGCFKGVFVNLSVIVWIVMCCFVTILLENIGIDIYCSFGVVRSALTQVQFLCRTTSLFHFLWNRWQLL